MEKSDPRTPPCFAQKRKKRHETKLPPQLRMPGAKFSGLHHSRGIMIDDGRIL